jgi:predicted glycogen debranching enzyme
MNDLQPDALPLANRPAWPVDFGREVCGDLAAAEEREWLVTNGLGGFASGTVAGMLTRRYHALLIAALRPPAGRTLLVSKFDEVADYDGHTYALGTNRWAGGAVDPCGYRFLERFHLEGTTPVWTFLLADARLEKRIWMQPGANTTYVQYRLRRARRPLALTVKALVNYRDYHATTRAGDWRMNVRAIPHGLSIEAFAGATPFRLLSAEAAATPAHQWYLHFDLAAERARGLDDAEDHLHAGTFFAELQPGAATALVATAEAAADLNGEAAWQANARRELGLLQSARAAFSGAPAPNPARADAPPWIDQLRLAASQFIVQRPMASHPDGGSIIAGYPWFADWGRDTMVALPGLTLATGRPEVAKTILRTFSRYVDQGMLPNCFPEAGEPPLYNSVDAALWYVEAARQYVAATGDREFLAELFPALADICRWYARGTRYNIHADRADGLLNAGQAGVQLTWMDAKVGDWVVTPRAGKPVEVNALWYNALLALRDFALALGYPASDYANMAEQVRHSFRKFWNAEAGYAFDVVDGPDGPDASLRPNQILAVSLPYSPLDEAQQRAVVDVCARHLLTSHGLRSLAPGDPRYRGRYAGTPAERDSAYHQGTVWGWLLGPFALAHLRVFRDPAAARSYLEPMAHHLRIQGLGTAGEIFDGDPPFAPRGAIAQAWTVGEWLRAWAACTKP